MDIKDVISHLKHSLEQLRDDDSVTQFKGGTFSAWKGNVRAILVNGLGSRANLLLYQFDMATRFLPMPESVVIPGYEEINYTYIFEQKLPNVRTTLENIIWQLETFGEPYVPPKAEGNIPKAFIAHGPKSNPLEKLRRFLTALGIQPLIIEEEPSEGRSINEQVEFYLDEADCAIVFGTADDEELKDGKLYPRRNVCIEIGRFQERFPNRIVYILEEAASLPSNISEKIYARFTPDSMDEAFIKTVLELRAFDLLRAARIDKE